MTFVFLETKPVRSASHRLFCELSRPETFLQNALLAFSEFLKPAVSLDSILMGVKDARARACERGFLREALADMISEETVSTAQQHNSQAVSNALVNPASSPPLAAGQKETGKTFNTRWPEVPEITPTMPISDMSAKFDPPLRESFVVAFLICA